MNIACISCPARYGVADEKITGKRVRITCKRCGTVLVIDGTVSPPNVTASTSIAPGPPGRGGSVAPAAPSVPAAPPAPAPEPFLVLFADERQERADVAQIVRFHRAGQLGPETLVWREGMENWQSPWDVEEIASAFRRMGYTRPTPVPTADMPRAEAGEDEATRVAPSGPDASSQLYEDDEATNVVDSSALASKRPLQRARGSRPAANPLREEDEQPTHVGRGPVARSGGTAKRASTAPRGTTSERAQRASARPAGNQAEAARRRESRRPSGSPTAERFASQALAGSEAEEEARERAAAAEAQGLMDATDEGQRLTGARNETSVLFSLDSLLKKDGPRKVSEPPRRPASVEESLLVDSGPSLPAGGGFAPALAAPDFTAPITAPPPQFAPAPATVEPVVYPHADSSRKWMMATAAVVVLSAVGFAWMSGVLNPLLGKGAAPAPSAAPPAEPAAAASASAAAPAPTATPEPEPSAAPSASASASASVAPAATTTAAPPVAAAPAPRTPSPAQAAAVARPAAPATGTATEAEPEAAPAAAPAPAAAGEAFDAAAAKTALTAAAANAASCKEPGGATGNGRVSITFAPSGRPTSVAVTGDLAGTTVGSCVAKIFRQTRVPPFSGEPITVAKSFSVE